MHVNHLVTQDIFRRLEKDEVYGCDNFGLIYLCGVGLFMSSINTPPHFGLGIKKK